MARNTFEEQMDDPQFRAFYERFKNNANYVVALMGKEDAVRLVMAYAFKEGKQSNV